MTMKRIEEFSYNIRILLLLSVYTEALDICYRNLSNTTYGKNIFSILKNARFLVKDVNRSIYMYKRYDIL
jgi:hypothetical protein